MTGPALSSAEVRSFVYSEVVELLSDGVDYDTAVFMVAMEIGSTSQKVRAVLDD